MECLFNLTVTQVGLLMDIAGVLLMFFFGLPANMLSSGEEFVTTAATDSDKNKASRYNVLSYAGLALLLLGFIFQFIGTY